MSHQDPQKTVLRLCGAKAVTNVQLLQTLWSGYGALSRYTLSGGKISSVIVKQVSPPDQTAHPRGWNTKSSHQRKLRSYAVESAWYQHYAHQCGPDVSVPRCFGIESVQDSVTIVLEDLDVKGFDKRKNQLTPEQMHPCLRWLAFFHAQFLHVKPTNLWPIGTYWHLGTRQDEFQALDDCALKNAASVIDTMLSDCPYQTLVHGDAKLDNFCFSSTESKVAAVDFQYVGGGCGMKDLAYFIGSCLDENQCEAHVQSLLDVYFTFFQEAMSQQKRLKKISAQAVEDIWRPLFPVAWADFHRFLKGWSPSHWKINSFSERITKQVIQQSCSNA